MAAAPWQATPFAPLYPDGWSGRGKMDNRDEMWTKTVYFLSMCVCDHFLSTLTKIVPSLSKRVRKWRLTRPQMSVSDGRPFYVHLRTNSASTVCSHLSIFDPCIAFKSKFVRNGLSVPHPLLSVLLIRPFYDQLCLNEVDLKRSTFGQLYPCVHSTWNHVQNLSSVLHTLLSVVLIVCLSATASTVAPTGAWSKAQRTSAITAKRYLILGGWVLCQKVLATETLMDGVKKWTRGTKYGQKPSIFCQCATIFCPLWQKSFPLYPNGSESGVWLTSTNVRFRRTSILRPFAYKLGIHSVFSFVHF